MTEMTAVTTVSFDPQTYADRSIGYADKSITRGAARGHGVSILSKLFMLITTSVNNPSQISNIRHAVLVPLFFNILIHLKVIFLLYKLL